MDHVIAVVLVFATSVSTAFSAPEAVSSGKEAGGVAKREEMSSPVDRDDGG